MNVRRLRPRSRGQALVETAIALPFLMVLLAGAAQVGAIVYGLVSTDTAAREAALAGTKAPTSSLTTAAAAVNHQYTCHAWQSNYGSVESNPICQSAFDSAGALNKTNMTVTITALTALSVRQAVPQDIVRLGNNNGCQGNDASISGTVKNIPTLASGTGIVVTAISGTSTVTAPANSSTGVYSLCSNPNSSISVSTSVVDNNNCTWGAQVTTSAGNNATVTGVNLPLTQQSCPTTSSSSSSSSTVTGSNTLSGSTSSIPALTCVTPPAVYFEVTVSYPVPLFVPFVNKLFGDSGGSQRTVTADITTEVAPCTVTNGN